METMELCVTACEKFSNNNEVLPLVTPMGELRARSPQPAPGRPFLGTSHRLGKASEGRGWCCLWAQT